MLPEGGIGIGRRIAELRKDEFDLTQEQMASKINVSRGVLSQWECGARSPYASDVGRIADVLGTTTDWLIRGIQPENAEIHAATGLSDEAIEALQAFHADDPTGQKTAALGKALSSASFLNVLASLLMVQPGEPGYYEASCSTTDGFYTVEMSPDSYAAALSVRLLHALEAIRTGGKTPLQPYPPAERRIAETTEKLRSEGRLTERTGGKRRGDK